MSIYNNKQEQELRLNASIERLNNTLNKAQHCKNYALLQVVIYRLDDLNNLLLRYNID